jgi:hypothetical protein
VVGTSATATVRLEVAAHRIIRAKPVPLGRAKVVIVLFHPKDLRWGHALVTWSFSHGWRGPFVPAPSTRTVKLSPHAIVLYTSVALPAGHYRWRACFHATGDLAMADPGRPPGCTGYGFHGAGDLPAGFPGPAAIARAEQYLNGRVGHTALAVVDSEGRLSGVRIHDTFITGSVVKAMLLRVSAAPTGLDQPGGPKCRAFIAMRKSPPTSSSTASGSRRSRRSSR